MAKSNKLTKFEIESSSGTLTDITAYVVSVRHGEFCIDFAPSFWKHPIAWIRYKLELRRARKVLSGLPNIELTISGPYIPDPWKWN